MMRTRGISWSWYAGALLVLAGLLTLGCHDDDEEFFVTLDPDPGRISLDALGGLPDASLLHAVIAPKAEGLSERFLEPTVTFTIGPEVSFREGSARFFEHAGNDEGPLEPTSQSTDPVEGTVLVFELPEIDLLDLPDVEILLDAVAEGSARIRVVVEDGHDHASDTTRIEVRP